MKKKSPSTDHPATEEQVIVARSLDGRITFWGAGAQKTFGYTPDETVGKHVSLIIPFDWQDEEYALIDKLRGGEAVSKIRTVRRTKEGYLLDVTMDVKLDHDATGQAVGVRKVYTDIIPRERLAQPVFDRLGGRDAMNRLTARLQSDTRIGPFFAGLPAEDVKRHQADFISVALGGPPMVRAEQRVDHLALEEENFDVVARHLESVLREMGVTSAQIEEVMSIVTARRSEAQGA